MFIYIKNNLKLPRRTLVKWISFSGIVAFMKPLSIATKTVAISVDNSLPALTAYIDLILPQDELPGALDLGIDKVILQKIEYDSGYSQALKQGVDWLNSRALKQGANNYVSLTEAQQLEIVYFSENSPMQSIANLFYQTVRQEVFQLYYAHPDVVKHFHYAQPPQPQGFLDFANPPNS